MLTVRRLRKHFEVVCFYAHSHRYAPLHRFGNVIVARLSYSPFVTSMLLTAAFVS